MSLSEKINNIKNNCGKNTCSFSVAEKMEEDVKQAVKELKKASHTTHSCPDKDDNYECSCTNPKTPDQNCWVIPKVKFNEIFGKELV